MQDIKKFLLLLVEQNQFTGTYSYKAISAENQGWSLGNGGASIGFIYRHTGEIMHLLATFLDEPTDVVNTTMRFQDTGQGLDIEASRELVASGFEKLRALVGKHPESWWLEQVDTPIFGTLERIRIFGHILNHNAHHSGQISLILHRGGDNA